jgi:hypothetical protein
MGLNNGSTRLLVHLFMAVAFLILGVFSVSIFLAHEYLASLSIGITSLIVLILVIVEQRKFRKKKLQE